jgi:outer membrane protein TolC
MRVNAFLFLAAMSEVAVSGSMAAAPAGEQPSLRLSMARSVELALARSEELGSARAEIDLARGRIREARAAALPHLDAEISYTRLSGIGGFFPGASAFGVGGFDPIFQALLDQGIVQPEDLAGLESAEFEDYYQSGLTLTQVVYQGGLVRAGLRAARVAEDQALNGLDLARVRVVHAAKAAYAGVLVREAVHKAAEEGVSLACRHLEFAEVHRAAGTAREFEVLQARVRLKNAEAAEIRARAELEVARAGFLRRIGLDQGREVELTDGLAYDPAPLPPVGRQLEDARRSRAEMRGADLAVRLAEIALDVSTAGRRPSVRVRAAYNGAGPEGFFDETFDYDWSLGVTVAIPLFDGFAASGKKMQERARLEQLKLRRESLLKDIEFEIRSARLRLEAARESVESASETVKEAEEALGLAHKLLEAGSGIKLDKEEARVALVEARTNLARAKLDHFTAVLDLERATGMLEAQSADVFGAAAP